MLSIIPSRFRLAILLSVGLLVSSISGCGVGGPSEQEKQLVSSVKIRSLDLNNLVTPVVRDEPVMLAAAKNEWVSYQIQLSGLIPLEKVEYTLRFQPLNQKTPNRAIALSNLAVYQILSMPVDVDRAGYVRHTGLSTATHLLPRALLPMTINDGRIRLASARDPERPTEPKSRTGSAPVMLWVDLHIPPGTPAGDYAGACEIMASGIEKPVASLPVSLTVNDFVIPDNRNLSLVGQLDWESLTRLYPDRFEGVSANLLNRNDARYAPAVKTLDQLIKMAQANRVEVVVPQLRPTVKWPGGLPPNVYWDDFDSVVSPWLKGDIFPDKIPLDYWPLPPCEGLSEYDPKSQRDYWEKTATHFDQNEWLAKCPVTIEKLTPGRASALECVKLSADAASVLSAHSRIRVSVPLEDDQLQFAGASNPNLILPDDSGRVMTAAPGIVFTPPTQAWPSGVTRPDRWMRTDLPGLIPYVGAGGDERDVRQWAWLSFLPLPPPQLGLQYGPVKFIQWAGSLPRRNGPNEPADPNELIWFYPGSWFGLDQPVETIQLKWLRRAQQDFEYLNLARQRGGVIDALVISHLITKPVELAASESPDPTYGMMSGTADPTAWDEAVKLLSKVILLHEPGQIVDPQRRDRLSLEILQWIRPTASAGMPSGRDLERPVILGRTTSWTWAPDNVENWISLKMGLDIYNASDFRPEENTIAWTSVPTGWQVQPQPLSIPALATYHVERVNIDGRVNPLSLRHTERRPVEITFINGFTKQPALIHMVLPVGPTIRRDAPINLDGSLDDWTSDDAIQDGPMVRMFDRPALQAQRLPGASTPSQIFTSWSDQKFYLGFKLTGLSKSPPQVASNFVNYPFRRAWGEDLCEVLIQSVFADNSTGPVLHLVCKPNGVVSVERKLDQRLYADPWEAFESEELHYATRAVSDWRGEIGIPWSVINTPDNARRLPVMLRFNFSQHRQETGESASWAGPVDFGRDDDFMGILFLRESDRPGMLQQGRN